MRQLSLVAAVTSSIALSALAQDGSAPPPAAGSAATVASWTEDQRSADAVERAKQFLAESAKVYQKAPSLVETVTIAVTMPGGMQTDDSMKFEYGPKNSFRMEGPGVQLIAVDGMAYFVPAEPQDKFLERKVEGGLAKTFGQMLPSYSQPTAAMALRDGLKPEEVVESFSKMFLENARIAGFRTNGGVAEMLVTGEGDSEVTVLFDAESKLQKGLSAVLTPPGMPPTMQINLDIRVKNAIADELPAPIVFVKGDRTAVTDVMELMTDADAAPKLKAGDPVPAAVLSRLEGGSVDIASLKGKVVVLDFWATWCAPCRRGLPLLDKFASQMKSNDKVVVYAVNVWEDENGDERLSKVKTFWNAQKLGIETLIDPNDEFINAFGFSGIPAILVIGPDGTIADVHVGFDAGLMETLTPKVTAALAK